MEERLARLESAVEQLAARMTRLEAKLARLAVRETDEEETPAPAAAASVPSRATPHTVASVLALAGRGVLAFAGAWLLRALADAGTIPLAAAVALGLAYAACWLLFADRASAVGRRLAAELHGLVAATIAYPLLWEGTQKFALLSPSAASLALAAFTAVALWMAWRRELRWTSWVVTLAALGTSFALLITTRAMVAFSLPILVLALATVWLAYSRRWHGQRWPVALVADVTVLQMTLLAARPGGPPEGYSHLTVAGVQAVAAALLLVYLGSFAVRTLMRRRDVTAFEALQTVAALVVGLGGAIRVSRAGGSGSTLLALAAVAVAVACYAVAFAFVDRRIGRGRNFVFYTSLALTLALTGTGMLLEDGPLSLLWCGLALIAAWLGGRFDRGTLCTHAAAYLVVAAWRSGLIAAAWDALVAPAGEAWHRGGAAGLAVMGSALAAFALLARTRGGRALPWHNRLPQLVAALVALLGVGSVAVPALASLFPGAAGPPGAAAVAAARSVVLAVATLLLAGLGARPALRELGWLVYPLLVLGGAKLLVDDLRHGRALTLVVAFAAYGLALILAPRWLRRDDRLAASPQ